MDVDGTCVTFLHTLVTFNIPTDRTEPTVLTQIKLLSGRFYHDVHCFSLCQCVLDVLSGSDICLFKFRIIIQEGLGIFMVNMVFIDIVI